jgi:hypothetical protein
MMRRRFLIGLLMLAFPPRRVLADDAVRPLESKEFASWSIDDYELALLREVLERTRPDYGPYEEQPFTEKVSDARVIQLAIDGRLVNILAAGVGQPPLEQQMIPVPFPIDKGLLGWRVFLIDRRNQDRLSRINSIEGLRQFRVGQGSDWSDVRIYEYNRIPVETTSNFESLFLMLLHGRFDLFPRGLSEIARELAAYGKRYPEIAIEQHLLLHYPFCDAYYVSRSAPHLAARLTAGLERMVADGSFDALFARYFGQRLADLNLRERVVIELSNPFLPAWVPLQRKELWFNPGRLP